MRCIHFILLKLQCTVSLCHMCKNEWMQNQKPMEEFYLHRWEWNHQFHYVNISAQRHLYHLSTSCLKIDMKNTKFQGSGDVGRGLPGNSQASETMDGHLSLSCTSQMRKQNKKKKINSIPPERRERSKERRSMGHLGIRTLNERISNKAGLTAGFSKLWALPGLDQSLCLTFLTKFRENQLHNTDNSALRLSIPH